MSSAPPILASLPATRARHSRMHLMMLLVTTCWAGNIIAGKDALAGFGPVALANVRILGTAAVFIICLLAAGKARALNLSLNKGFFLVAMAGGGIALNQLMFIGALARSSVAHTGLIVALGPVMVLVIAVLMRLEVLTTWKIIGMLVAFMGIGILTADKGGPGGAGQWVGDLIMLGGTFVFAVYTVLVKEVADLYDTLTLNTLIFVMGAIMMVPFCAHDLVKTHWASVRFGAWWGLAFLIVFGSVVSYLLFAYVLTELSASRVAAFNYLQPVISTGLAIWLLSERLTVKVLVGGALILAGVYLTERERGEGEEGPKSVVRGPLV